MSTIGDLVVMLGMNTSGFESGAKRSKSIASSMAAGISSALGPIAATLAGAFAVGSMISGAREAATSEQKLAAVLAATGHTADLSAKQISTFAAQLQQTTNFEDDATVAAAAMLATFKNIKGDNFKAVLTTAADMSTILGGDMASNVKLLGKALNDPTEGLGKLAKAGVQFTEQQEAQIKALQKSGDLMGSQGVILDALSGRFKGAAANVADPFDRLKNNIGDIGKTIGGALLPPLNAIATTTSQWLNAANDLLTRHSSILLTVVTSTQAVVGAYIALKVSAMAVAAYHASAAIVLGLTNGALIALKWGSLGAALAERVLIASSIMLQAVMNPAAIITLGVSILGATALIVGMNHAMSNTASAATGAFQPLREQATAVGELGDEADDAATKVAKLTSIQRENEKLRLFILGEGDEKKVKRLEFALDPTTTKSDLENFDYLTARTESLKKMTEATEKQAKAQEDLFAKDNEAIKNATAMKDQIAVLTGTMTEQLAAQRALERQGFTPEQAEFQSQLETQKEKLKADQDAAKTTAALKDEIDVLIGAMTKEEAMRKALVRSGLTEEQAAEQAKLETEKSNLEEEENAIKKQDQKDKKLNDRISLKASLAGSQEAASILTRGLGGGKGDIEKNQLTTLKKIAELTAANKPPATVAANF